MAGESIQGDGPVGRKRASTPPDEGDGAGRRAATVRRTLLRADDAAARGDFVEARTWMDALVGMGEVLPPAYARKHAEWTRRAAAAGG